MRNTDGDYRGIWKEVLGIFAIVVFIVAFFSCCNIFQSLKKDKSEVKSDSTNVKKETESSSKVDTSKTKTETLSTKETVYYPQPIYIQGKDGETKVVYVPQKVTETGASKEEKQNFNYEQYAKEKVDSTKIAEMEKQLAKQSEIKGSVLGVGFWLAVAGVGVVTIGVMIMLLKFKNQINLLTKN